MDLPKLTGNRASTATLVRIPYLSGLSDVDNFLHSTYQVAIWSTIETGIAISASSLATLRPLFRQFLEVTKLPSSATRAGYQRQGGRESTAFKLGSFDQKNTGVTTIIRAGSINTIQRDSDSSERRKSEGLSRKQHLTTYERNESSDWGRGITKTTVISNV